jgi:ADP-ribose pyrophosphatase YjhB (NUDIX family)
VLAGDTQAAPVTSAEAVTTIIFIMFGLIMTSMIISYLADTLLAFRIANKESMDKKRALRTYLKQAHVPASFAISVEKQVAEVINTPMRTLEKDVELLTHISTSVRDTLRAYVFGGALRSQRFIRACQGFCPTTVRDLCSNALVVTVYSPGDYVFKYGEEATGAHFVHWGRFEMITRRQEMDATKSTRFQRGKSQGLVIPKPSVKPMGSRRPENTSATSRSLATRNSHRENIKECTWLCELALFCHMKNVGTMQAGSRGENLTLDGQSFITVMRTTPELSELAQDYSACIVEAMKRDANSAFLSGSVLHESVLSLMPNNTRIMMSQAGLNAFSQTMGNGGRAKHQKAALEAEVRKGACALVVESDIRKWSERPVQNVLRMVSVVALRLRREDGRILVQVGRVNEAGEATAKVALPGEKVGHGELPVDALHRLLEEQLGTITQGITIGNEEVHEESKDSEKFSILTKYCRYIFVANFFMQSFDENDGIRPPTIHAFGKVATPHSNPETKHARFKSGFWRSRTGVQAVGKLRTLRSTASNGRAADLLETLDVFLLGDRTHIFAWVPVEMIDDKRDFETFSEAAKTWLPGLEAVRATANGEESVRLRAKTRA